MKLGLFGGTFNPVHFGHISLAVEVQQFFNLDKVYFIPSRTPPHKSIKELVSAKNRCQMIIRALPLNLSFSLSQVDLYRDGPSYAIDTLYNFSSNLIKQNNFYFLLGVDAFLEFHTWKSYKKIVNLTKLIVVSRENKFSNLNTNFLNLINNYILKNLSSKYEFCSNNLCWHHKNMKSIYYFNMKSLNISSTMIRRNIRLGKDFSCFVPSAVADYIRVRGLYI